MQALQIRESESRLVSRLFIFEFFQGASIAIYFTAAISIFLEHLPATELPKVFILSALMLWLFGFLYSKLEHVLLTRHLIVFVLLFNGLCVVLFRLLMPLQDEKWFLYIFLASFNILYLLNNLEFWGLVALIFDVRQSKRLFSIVSAGDVPAKMVGYLMAFAFSSLIGTENLLWIAAGCVIIAGLLFLPLSRVDEMKKLAPTKHHHYATQSLQNIQASIRGNKLIRHIALVSFFSFGFYIIVNFVLYGYIKTRFHTDKSLALFFSVFFAVSRFITLFTKLAFTNRIVDSLGLRKALVIAPSLLMVLTIIASIVQSQSVAFYIYGVMAIAADILRSAIQSPVLLATLQPLPAAQRLRGHTIIKGLMDPFAYFASGVLLLAILSSPIDLDFVTLSLILSVIAAAWLIFCLSVDKKYITMLTAAIRKRLIDGREITITDNESLNFLLTRMEKGDEREALSVLQIVSAQPVNHEKFYLAALHHHSMAVRRQTLQLILDQKYHSLLPELKQMLQQQKSPGELHHFVRVVGMMDQSTDISGFLQHEDRNVANAAVMALLSNPEASKKAIGETHLATLFSSSLVTHRVQALRIVKELKAGQYAQHVYELLQQEHEETREHALETAGLLADEWLTDRLLDHFATTEKDHAVLNALRLAGDVAADRIRLFLQSNACSVTKRKKLFATLGKIGSGAAINALHESLQRYPQDTATLLSALYHLKYQCSKDTANFYENLLRQMLANASGNLFTLHFLQNHQAKYALVIRALELELTTLRDNCIYLFSFLYDAEKIRRAKSGFDLGTRDSMANSFELIERIIPREHAVLFTALFEYAELPYRYSQLKKLQKPPVISIDSIIKNILVDKAGQFDYWTKSCLLYCLKDENGRVNRKIVESFLHSENAIIKEIAERIA